MNKRQRKKALRKKFLRIKKRDIWQFVREFGEIMNREFTREIGCPKQRGLNE